MFYLSRRKKEEKWSGTIKSRQPSQSSQSSATMCLQNPTPKPCILRSGKDQSNQRWNKGYQIQHALPSFRYYEAIISPKPKSRGNQALISKRLKSCTPLIYDTYYSRFSSSLQLRVIFRLHNDLSSLSLAYYYYQKQLLLQAERGLRRSDYKLKFCCINWRKWACTRWII